MTIICYRDGIIASDSWILRDDCQFASMKKIIKTKKGALVGACGNACDLSKFFDWARRDTYIDPPDEIFEDDFSGVMILPDKRMLLWEDILPTEIEAEYFSLGIGYQIALGAFVMGASAEAAVSATTKHCRSCGGPIQIEKLNG